MTAPGPIIPPNAALTVGGRLDAETHAALTEARRLRDAWAAATLAAQAAAHAAAQAQLHEALAALGAWRQEAEAQLVRDAQALALALAERLVRTDLSAALATLLAGLPPATDPAGGSALVVSLNPQDLQALGVPPAGVTLLPDDALPRGAIRVAGPAGEITRTVRGQLHQWLAP